MGHWAASMLRSKQQVKKKTLWILWMILHIISISISSAKNMSRTWCGTCVSKGSSTVQLIEKHSCKHSIYKMVFLWSLKTRFSICRYFMMSFSFQVLWIIRMHRRCILTWLDAMRHRERIDEWNALGLRRYQRMSNRYLQMATVRRPRSAQELRVRRKLQLCMAAQTSAESIHKTALLWLPKRFMVSSLDLTTSLTKVASNPWETLLL